MKKVIKDLLPYVIIIVGVVLLRTFLITPIRVDGPSMNPTLKHGDIMILNKVAKIDRFDIVVLRNDNTEGTLIKRVVGMPGEVLEVKDGILYINGKKINDKYSFGKTKDIGKIKIPDDEYFVLGDNRPISADSRYFGTFKKSDIKGTAHFILFPFKRFGKVN